MMFCLSRRSIFRSTAARQDSWIPTLHTSARHLYSSLNLAEMAFLPNRRWQLSG
jgi:hypothetical protein